MNFKQNYITLSFGLLINKTFVIQCTYMKFIMHMVHVPYIINSSAVPLNSDKIRSSLLHNVNDAPLMHNKTRNFAYFR